MKQFFYIKKFGVLLFFLLAAKIVNGQNVKVNTQVDKKEIVIGDHINLAYIVDFNPQKFRVQLPTLPDSFNQFELINRSPQDTTQQGQEIVLRQKNTITHFDSGVWVIPSQSFTVTPLDGTPSYEIQSDSMAIVVNTVAVDTSKPIKPIFEIIAAQKTFWEEYENWIYGIGALLLAGVLLFLIIKKYRGRERKVSVAKKVYVTPWDNAQQKIESLVQRELWKTSEEKEHHTQLTDIIRTYIEDAFGLDCFEKTSQEIVTDVKKYLQKNKFKKRGDELDKLRTIFMVADMVKFAKSKPTEEEHEKSNYDAQSFIESTATFLQKLKKENNKA